MEVEILRKRMYKISRTVPVWLAAIFAGKSLFRVCDYKMHSGLYVMQPAPWYLDIGVDAVLTAIGADVCFVVAHCLKDISRDKDAGKEGGHTDRPLFCACQNITYRKRRLISRHL